MCESGSKKRVAVDSLYDTMQIYNKAREDLVGESEDQLKAIWDTKVKPSLQKRNPYIAFKEPLVVTVERNLRVKVVIDPPPPTTPTEKVDFLWDCIKKVLTDVWRGEGNQKLAASGGFKFDDDIMVVKVHGYLFQLGLVMAKDSIFSIYHVEYYINENVRESDGRTRQKLELLWEVMKEELGVGTRPYDCATAALGPKYHFDKNTMICKLGDGFSCRLELQKLRTGK